MEIKVVYMVIHDATVDRYVSASRKCFNIAEKNLCLGQVGGVTYCSDNDHLLRCGQTVAPRYHVLKAFQCIRLYGNHSLQNSACGREGGGGKTISTPGHNSCSIKLNQNLSHMRIKSPLTTCTAIK